MNSLTLLARARNAYLDAIVDYDRAQFELYVALGQPPADALAHPVPTEGVTPPGEPLIILPVNPLNPVPDVPEALPDRNASSSVPRSPSSPPRPPT